jgi:hypothetical protein
MLLGMAGQSHWSLAVELVTSPDGEWLVFDHACRAAAAPRCLGSRYRLGPGTRWDAETDRLVSPSGSARLRVDASALVPVLASPSELEIAPRSAPLVTPSIPSTVAYPATIRWRYSIEVATPER